MAFVRQLCVQTARGAGRLLLCMVERVRAAPSSQYKSAKRLYCEEFCTHQKNKAFISNMIMQLTNPKKPIGQETHSMRMLHSLHYE